MNRPTVPGAPGVGDAAPEFSLPSIQGSTISLTDFHGHGSVLLWFSRGFTCNFCRGYMQDFIAEYDAITAANITIVQVVPNLFETSQSYFAENMPPYPFLCDPDKRLFAVYGLGDDGALIATRNTIISFGTAFTQGDGIETVRASWKDVANRNFVRRLHHHAMSAMEQGLFFIDPTGVIRYRLALGALEAIPPAAELLAIGRALST